MLTDSMKENKGWNRFYFLPLALGLLGLVFQFVRDPKGGSVIGFLFLLTGIAIVIYLNQYPLQPRERDYAYAGSFYAFAIWIGLGVMALFDACRAQMTKPRLIALGIPLGIGLFMFGLGEYVGCFSRDVFRCAVHGHCRRLALRSFDGVEQCHNVKHHESRCFDWPCRRGAHSHGFGRLGRS